jgi:hypothetical protein
MRGRRAWISAVAVMIVWASVLSVPEAAVAAPNTAAVAGEQSPEEAATAAAEASGERVEILTARTEDQQVFANPDGSFTMEMSAGPERARKGTGWVDPDPTLVRRADGTITPSAPVNPVEFSGGGTAPLARLSESDRSIELTWPTPLPAPTLSGDTATYAEVIPGVDLQLTAHAQGFSPVLVVKTAAAASDPRLDEVDFGLAAQGVTVTKESDGSLAARDEAGGVVFASSRVEMTDSPEPVAATAKADDEEPTEQPTVGDLAAVGEIELSGDELTLIPDQELLDNPAATYPVRIDPYWSAPGNAWAKVLSGKAGSAYWFGGQDGPEAKVGYCGWGGCNGIGTARSYFQFSTHALAGAHILGAEFNVRENWSPSCTATPLELYRTDPIGPATTWNHQPGMSGPGTGSLGSRTVAYGYNASCGPNWIGYPVGGAISPGGLTTFMLKASNNDETQRNKYSWKKFDSFASRDFAPRLIVTYNWPPNVPSDLWANAGRGPSLGCPAERDRAFTYSARPNLHATLTDPDGQNLAARFEWWHYGGRAPVGSAQTAGQASGTRHQVTIPSGAFTNDSRISWRVQAFDGTDWSPWSRFCQLTVDTTKPGRPKVSSADYPENGFSGYVGKTGEFQVTAAAGDKDVLGFQWSLNFQDLPAVVNPNSPRFVPAKDGKATFTVTPMRGGPNELYVRAVDHALNVSDVYRTPDSDGSLPPAGGYHFLVGTSVPPPTGHWPLDGDFHADPRNAAPDLSAGKKHATVSGTSPASGARWTFGRAGESLQLTGADTGYATTGAPAVNTNETFSVSAWVMLDRQDAGSYAAVSQDGSKVFGFFLGYVGDDQRFTFRMVPQDSQTVVTVRALSTAAPRPNVWYHLTGTFDSSTKELRLYVNGQHQGTASMPTSWNATGALQIGRDWYDLRYREWWPGRIDDVKVWNRRLPDAEIQALANTPVVEEAFYPLDEGVGTRTADVSGNYRLGTLTGSAIWQPGVVGDHAVELDGNDDAVVTSQQAVRTDDSFTVTARARLDQNARTTWQTVVSQDGPNSAGFALQYRDGKWAFIVSPADSASPNYLVVQSADPARTGRWVDLAGVYDAATGSVRLYVGSAEHTAPGRVTAHVPGNVVIGRSKHAGVNAFHFDGRVDDVHLYTGVLTKRDITNGNVNPVTTRPNLYSGQLSRFVNHDGRHFASNGPVPPGTLFERGLGMMAPLDASDTRMLYSCQYNGGWFTSTAANCENATHTVLGEIGPIYKNPPPGRPSYALHRCMVPDNGDHYNAIGGSCENAAHTNEGLQGYVLAYRQLIRYVSDLPPHDRLTTITLGVMPAGYRPEGTQGIIAMTGEAGTIPIRSCVDGSDEFLSTHAACDGASVRRVEGSIWTAPPAFAAESAPLFSCRVTTSGERFTSLDEFCESETVAGQLGFVITRLH